MNEFAKGLTNYLSHETIKKLQKVKIGVLGAGGLGSNCAVNLVRCGFIRFKIIDFDVVETSNLNRQFYFVHQIGMPKVLALKKNLLAINPDVQIEEKIMKLETEKDFEYFEDCDVIIEAFDNVEYKTMVVEKYHSSGRLLVTVSGLAGWGNSDDIKIKQIHSKFFMIGDFVSEVGEDLPPLSPRVNIVAAKQADVVLEYFL